MAKVDPRADPVSEPPQAKKDAVEEERKEDFSVDRVVVPNTTGGSKAGGSEPPEKAPLELESSVVPVDKPAKKVTSQDPRYEPVEKLLDLNDWKKIGDELGPIADIGKLPPNLGLVAALARNEVAKDGDPEAVVTAIRCMAGVLGVAEDSPIARVLARRMLRKNPVRVRDIKAPAARTSVLIVLITLVLGGGVGWLVSLGSWRAIAHLIHLQ